VPRRLQTAAGRESGSQVCRQWTDVSDPQTPSSRFISHSVHEVSIVALAADFAFRGSEPGPRGRMSATEGDSTMTFTNVSADAVNTIEWLAAGRSAIAVPVYQRQYRWEIDGCQQLLDDIRGVATGDARQTHFLGSILYTATSSGQVTERTLVDGQQRVATLMLLVAALRDTLARSDQAIAAQLHSLLVHPNYAERTRLQLRKEGAREFDGIVFDNPLPVSVERSHLRDNYAFFLGEVRDDALDVWKGLQKLEHVAITLEEHANPQQVFESLNSTRTPLRNHELIHNYILMGLTYDQQTEIEESFWVPIEDNTGDALGSFLRDYLILRTGRDSEFSGEHGVYDVFKKQFPRPTFQTLTTHAAEWKTYAEVYRILLTPDRAGDRDIGRQLHHVNTFGTAMYPLLLGVYRDYQLQDVDKETLLAILEQLQSLYLRKMVVGASRDHLAAQLCRKRRQYGYQGMADTVRRRTPSDERIRRALTYRPLPHAGYVLHRIDEHQVSERTHLNGLQIEHIFPQFPKDTWSGNGTPWHALTEVERAKYREVLPTIGNLTLLEPELNAGASNKPFKTKQEYYEQSKVPSTHDLVNDADWDLATIENRTEKLTTRFLDIWQRRPGPVDPEQLVPILDASKLAGWYPGWKTEFEYAIFDGEVWEVRNVKQLFKRVFKRLWDTHRDEVLAYSESHNGPIFQEAEKHRRFDVLPGSHYLFMGLYPQYMLGEIRAVLDDLDMADDLFVKYATEQDEPVGA
jgi:hypothetical protein